MLSSQGKGVRLTAVPAARTFSVVAKIVTIIAAVVILVEPMLWFERDRCAPDHG